MALCGRRPDVLQHQDPEPVLSIAKDQQAHHLIEKRFAKTLKLTESKIPSIALTAEEHQKFTNAWRDAIGYIGDNNSIITLNATREDVWLAAQRIYADFPEVLEAIRGTLW